MGLDSGIPWIGYNQRISVRPSLPVTDNWYLDVTKQKKSCFQKSKTVFGRNWNLIFKKGKTLSIHWILWYLKFQHKSSSGERQYKLNVWSKSKFPGASISPPFNWFSPLTLSHMTSLAYKVGKICMDKEKKTQQQNVNQFVYRSLISRTYMRIHKLNIITLHYLWVYTAIGCHLPFGR